MAPVMIQCTRNKKNMAASYPGAIKSFRTMANKTGISYDADKTKIIFAEDFNYEREEIVAVETELGTNPKGSDADVKTRLNRLERKLPRIGTTADSATPTPAADDVDMYTVTALAQAATFGAPTGTPVNGQKLIIRVKDNGTARALSWNAIYRAGTDVALPTTTVLSKTLYCGFIYNSADSKWDLVAVTNNI